MNTKMGLTMVLAGLLSLPLFTAVAADNEQLEQKEQAQVQQQVYGWQLMTDEELAVHRAKMRNATSAEEREAYRQEHHKLMQARAKDQGVSIPDQPGTYGKGCCGGRAGGWK